METAVAWQAAIERENGPTALALSRQDVDHQPRDAAQVAAIARGGYVLSEPEGEAQALIIGTGSELEMAVAAADRLAQEGVAVRVVSMPCIEAFDAQGADYRESVLPATIAARVAVEAGVSDSWYRFVGATGHVVGVNDFGSSAPAGDVYADMGVTVDSVVDAVRAQLG